MLNTLTNIPTVVSVDDGLGSARWQELHHFAELGRLSACLLHELSNPLTAALLHLELCDQQSSSIRQARRDIQILKRYVEAARQQVRQQSKATSFSVNAQIDQLKRIVVPLSRRSGVRLDISLSPVARLFGDPVKFQQIVANLVVNAIEAYAETDKYTEAALVQMAISESQNCLTVLVTDWGRGIAPSDISQSFEPFYSTKDHAGHSLGLGLAMVKQYVTEDFCGTIKVSSTRRCGTKFTIRLPILNNANAQTA